MAAIRQVLAAFQAEQAPDFRSVQAQDKFAEAIQKQWDSEFAPSKRYLQELVRQYIRLVDENAIESESLLELLLRVLQGKKSDAPDPEDPCHVSFWIQSRSTTTTAVVEPLRIRIYPYHNDVALRIWEAGAVLAEYLVKNNHLVQNQRVVELGAGTGVTGLVAAGVCRAEHVLCTDFTMACLENLQYNMQLNRLWLQNNKGISISIDSLSDFISPGYLQWGVYESRKSETSTLLDEATVLLGADLAYDWSCIEPLAQTIRRFLQPSSNSPVSEEKVAILAATTRNKATSSFLHEKLKPEGIDCHLEMGGQACAELPLLFPLKFTQPRSDVSIYSLRLNQAT